VKYEPPTLDSLGEDLKTAMKERESLRVSVIRMLMASVKNAQVAAKGDLDEKGSVAIVAKEVRRREDAAAEYRKAGNEQRASSEAVEAEILRAYLPAQLSAEELEKLVDGAIAEVQAAGPSDMGKVMKVLMPKVAGRADGATVSEAVKARLT
jgi:hypothetical protein